MNVKQVTVTWIELWIMEVPLARLGVSDMSHRDRILGVGRQVDLHPNRAFPS